MDTIHISRLKYMAQSPAHFIGAEAARTYTLERGSGFHGLVLGNVRVIPYPGAVRRGKEWEAFEADNTDSIILTKTEFAKCEAMAKAVRDHREAMRVLDGVREKQIDWTLGTQACAGTPDVVSDQFVTELKSAKSSNPKKFRWQALQLGYHAQLAWYQDGVAQTGQAIPENAYCVAVEPTAPFVVTVFKLSERDLDLGRRLYRSWFEQMLACEASGFWPGYEQSVVSLDIPDDPSEEPALDWGETEEAA